MTYPSKTPAARKKESAERRKKGREQLAAVNAKLAPMGLTHDSLLRGIVDGTVKITVKEKES